MKTCLYLLLFGSILMGNSQEFRECGTELTPESIAFMEQWKQQSSRMGITNAGDVLVTIPIKFHALKNTSGDGGMTESTKNNIIENLNSYYIESNILFEHLGEVNEIIDDNNYDFDSANEGAVAVPNDIPKTINVYFFESIISGGSGLCGYTNFPPSSDRVFMAYGCISGGTFEHEIGHYFTLFHTHGKTNTGTTDELVDQSNCVNAGDNICDTSADPNLSGNVNSSCAYTGTARDANGDSYTPDPRNFMSYSIGACRDRFSNGQYDRIRQGFEIGRSYLNFTTEGFSVNFISENREECIGGVIEFKARSFGASSYFWEFEGGEPATSSSSTPIVTYNSSGSFNVKLTTTNNAAETANVSRTNYITIDDPLENTLNAPFSSEFDSGLNSELNVTNPDFSLTFELSSVDRNESLESGSIWINNYDYLTENLVNIDGLRLSNYATIGIKKFTIDFEYAYTYLPADNSLPEPPPANYDSISLIIRAQCGSQETNIWQTGGEDLSTADPTLEPFVPSTNDWKNISIEVMVEGDVDYLGLEFVSHSYGGNNLYIDNLQVIPDYSVDVPTNFRLSKIQNGEATLRWLDASINETAFILERATNGGDFEELTRVGSNVIFYRDGSIVQGNSYIYRLYAKGINEHVSVFTNEVSVIVTDVREDWYERIEVWPNPAEEFIIVTFPENSTPRTTITISDISGKILLSANSFMEKEMALNVQSIKPGLYFVHVQNQEISSVKKLIIK